MIAEFWPQGLVACGSASRSIWSTSSTSLVQASCHLRSMNVTTIWCPRLSPNSTEQAEEISHTRGRWSLKCPACAASRCENSFGRCATDGRRGRKLSVKPPPQERGVAGHGSGARSPSSRAVSSRLRRSRNVGRSPARCSLLERRRRGVLRRQRMGERLAVDPVVRPGDADRRVERVRRRARGPGAYARRAEVDDRRPVASAMNAWPRPSSRYMPRRSTSSSRTLSHCPNVGEPTRRSTTTSRTAPVTHVTYLAWPGGTSEKWMPRTHAGRRHGAVGLGQVEVVARPPRGTRSALNHSRNTPRSSRCCCGVISKAPVDGERADLHGRRV